MKKSILYFEVAGPENTEETIRLSKERCLELGISDVVVASTHGKYRSKGSRSFLRYRLYCSGSYRV